MSSTAVAVFTATATVGSTFSTVVPSAESHPHSSLLSGDLDPVRYDPNNPLLLIVIQLTIILAFSRVLAWPLSKLRQPRVLSEILAGILLGPTAMGRIPGFTSHIFPPASIPSLNLLSTLGLSLFLFVIGLEVDFGLFKRNLVPCLAVSFAGIAIPFGLGCALSVGLYNQFIDNEVKFVNFMIFIGTASSITAFPVLARILTELRLMDDNIGIIVLASGVFNDVLGWFLLALSVALSASAEGQIVVYILLCGVGYVLLLWFIFRPVFTWLGRRDGSFDGHGPTQTYIAALLVAALASYWFMEQIGLSGYFGIFLCGVVLELGLGKAITEKIEDLVLTILVPLYFATSGLKTNLGLLNSGIIWAYVICVMVVAFCGKFFGCAAAAKLCGFSWRESGAVGSLMAAKGLIELIVLNIGLQVGVINTTVFSIFVLEALVLTFAATPLTLAFYPLHLRKPTLPPSSTNRVTDGKEADVADHEHKQRYTVVLDRFENLSPLLVFSRLVATPPTFAPSPQTTVVADSTADYVPGVGATDDSLDGASFNTLRLIEMTDRTSAVMHTTDPDDLLRRDPLMTLYSTFANLNGLRISTSSLAIVEQHLYAETVATRAARSGSDLILVPWKLAQPGEETTLASYIPNPFESLFGKSSNEPAHLANTNFLRDLFAGATSDVGVFLDRGDTVPRDALPGHYHLFLPFHGGSDDRACLDLVTRLARGNRGVSVTVLIVTRAAEPTEEDRAFDGVVSRIDSRDKDVSPAMTNSPAQAIEYTIQGSNSAHPTNGRAQDTLYPTQHHLETETADAVALEQVKAQTQSSGSVTLIEVSTARPLRTVTRRAADLALTQAAQSRFVWVVGRGRRDAASHRAEGLDLLREAEQARRLGVCASADARRCFGEAGVAALLSGVGSNVLVVQSRATGGKRNEAQA